MIDLREWYRKRMDGVEAKVDHIEAERRRKHGPDRIGWMYSRFAMQILDLVVILLAFTALAVSIAAALLGHHDTAETALTAMVCLALVEWLIYALWKRMR